MSFFIQLVKQMIDYPWDDLCEAFKARLKAENEKRFLDELEDAIFSIELTQISAEMCRFNMSPDAEELRRIRAQAVLDHLEVNKILSRAECGIFRQAIWRWQYTSSGVELQLFLSGDSLPIESLINRCWMVIDGIFELTQVAHVRLIGYDYDYTLTPTGSMHESIGEL